MNSKIVKFNVQTSAAKEIESYFIENGFVILQGLDMDGVTRSFRTQLKELIHTKYQNIDPKHETSIQSMFTEELPSIHDQHRDDFVHILDAGQALPGIYGMMDHPEIRKALELIGCVSTTMNWPPRLRMDFPKEEAFLMPDHQDRHYNGGSSNAVTVYFQVADSGVSPLWVRPRSHTLGDIGYKRIEVRPYLVLNEGSWQDDFPEVAVPLPEDELLLFHMDLIHRSGVNTSEKPRITVQLRFNNNDDNAFKVAGWPLTYRVVIKKDGE